MYIWKVSPLIQELKSEGISQKEQLKYFLTLSILMLLATDPYLNSGFEYVAYDSINTVVVTVITILGILYCYKVNEEADGKDFILRFMTLGLPTTVRFLVVVVLVTFIYYSFIDSSDSVVMTTQPIDVLFIASFEVGYYFYLSRKFSQFAKP